MTRPSWPETFLTIAATMARRSTCPRLSVGAVITTPEHQILSTGYNGAPRGLPHCTDVGCLMVGGSCTRAVHAEMNAIGQGARVGVSLRGGILYCTHRPCVRCANMIVQVGIQRVIYAQPYATDSMDDVAAMFEAGGVALELYQEAPSLS